MDYSAQAQELRRQLKELPVRPVPISLMEIQAKFSLSSPAQAKELAEEAGLVADGHRWYFRDELPKGEQI